MMAGDGESEQWRPAKGRKGSGLTEAEGGKGKQGRLAETREKIIKGKEESLAIYRKLMHPPLPNNPNVSYIHLMQFGNISIGSLSNFYWPKSLFVKF